MLNGVGVVASKKRNINLSNAYDAYFPTPSYSDPILVHQGDNLMTINRFIPEVVNKYSSDTQKIAELLKKETIEATCRAIFNFVYKNIQYSPDSPFEEQIRRPARTWADRVQGVDCDCYTTLISSILTNLRIPHYLRMAEYNPTRGFQHIYVIVPKDPSNLKGSYWTIDPVLDRFNEEKKPFTKVHDKIMKPIDALNVGVNGFPVRMLNGGLSLRSPFVYDDVLYSPELNTWGLRGIDGGIYIEGDPNRRYVEPLNGLGVGWLSTALSVGKKLFKGAKKVIKKIKVKRVEKKASKTDAKEAAQDRVQRIGANLTQAVADNSDSKSMIDRMDGDNTKSILSEFASSQIDLDKKLKSLNNSTILSLQSLDSKTKEKISEVVGKLSPELSQIIDESKSAKEIAAKTQQAASALLMNTSTINKKDEERTQGIIQSIESSSKEQKEGTRAMLMNTSTLNQAITKSSKSNKYTLIVVGALALVVVFFTIKGNKQTKTSN